MASLPIAHIQWQPSPAARRTASDMIGTAPAPARLSPLEWSVVALAEQDKESSLREPGRIATALNSIFGIRPTNRLANDRLEALRRVAVLAWRHRWNVSKIELARFFEAGFTPDHYELLQLSIGKAIAGRARKTVR